MSTREKILDDVARYAGEAIGLASGAGKQVGDVMRARVDDLAMRLDLVPREEFERLEAMLIKARSEQDEMKKRLDAIEAALSVKAKK